jgi:L-histidine N-alpha-methyltransferase
VGGGDAADAADASAPAPADEALLREVAEGLGRSPRQLSPRFFYDTRGSELFEEITRLPEYYPTRTERALLDRWMPSWIRDVCPAALVELGAGSAVKTRILLDAMEEAGAGGLFVPLDVSGEFLEATVEALRVEYPDLAVEPEVADLTRPFDLSVRLPSPTLFAFLGSTLGNFEDPAAVRLLSHLRATMRVTDRVLLGADLKPGTGKSVARLESAYNDSRGVTAAFNLNMLGALNRDLGTDFDVGAFEHRAFWAEGEGRIEMHLVARCATLVNVPGRPPVRIAAGESIRTEISRKYDRPTLTDLLGRGGLDITHWEEDEEGLYAMVLARPTGALRP